MAEPTYTGWAGVTSLAVMVFYAVIQGVATWTRRRRVIGSVEASSAGVDLRRFEALLTAQERQTNRCQEECAELRVEIRKAEIEIDRLQSEVQTVREKLNEETRQRILLEEILRRQGTMPRHWPGEKPEGGSP